MVAKKIVTKKTIVKKPVKKVVRKLASKKPAPMRSFRVYRDEQPFVRVGLTRQTLYWTILLVFIVITQLWILKIQMDIAALTALIAHP